MSEPIHGGTLLLVAGIALITCFVGGRLGLFKLPQSRPSFRLTIWQVMGAFALFLGAFALVFAVAIAVRAHPAILRWLTVIAYPFVVALFIGYLAFLRAGTRQGILWGGGEKSVRRFGKDFLFGMATLLVGYPVTVLVSQLAGFLSMTIWGERGVNQVAVEQLKKAAEYPSLFAAMVILVVVIVPFLEELLFRGFLQSYLRKFLGRIGGVLLSSAIFALVHFSSSQGVGNFELICSLFTLSCFIGLIYEKRGSLFAPVALHMTFNGLSTAYILFTI